MTRGAMGPVPVMQKKIFAAKRRNAGIFKDWIGEIFVRRERRRRGIVLRIIRSTSAAEMNAVCPRLHAEQKPRSAVGVRRREAELCAGIFGIDRLVRVEAGLSRANVMKAAHAI